MRGLGGVGAGGGARSGIRDPESLIHLEQGIKPNSAGIYRRGYEDLLHDLGK